MKERSLVAFTLLAQMAVGAFWTVGALEWWRIYINGTNLTLLSVPLIMVLGLLASFLHLGAPLNAWRALSNLGSSWLSREIVCALLFTGASALVAALEWRERDSGAVPAASAWAATLLGLALIFSMAQSYRLRTVPAWDTWFTPLAFFTTALLLGGLATGVTLAFAPAKAARSALQWIAAGAIVLWGVQLAAFWLWIARLAGQQGAAARAAHRVTREHGALLRLRLALAVPGMLVAAGLLLGAQAKIAAITALLLALGSAVLERTLFYAARVRHGV